MDKLRAIRLFVRTVELGSFTRVAEEEGTAKSLISKEVSRLEKEVGARLLQRSTRRLQLTEVGEGYLRRCREILLKLDDADGFVQQSQSQPKGRLRINASMALGMTELGRAFAQFMQAYPEIELDVHLSDEAVDLIEHGFDLGIRVVSRPVDSQYIGRPLARFNYHVCASPDYLAQRGPIDSPVDLKQHNCFIYSYFRGGQVWPLGEGVAVKGSLRANNTLYMLEAIKQGVGIGLIPEFVCREALASGEVVSVLQESIAPKLTLYALYPARQFVPPKLLRCIEFLERWFQEKPAD